MKLPSFHLATLTAVIITAMLLLSVCLAYIGVNWYSTYLEDGLLQQLPGDAAIAYRDMNNGVVPDVEALRQLFEYLNTLAEPLDWSLYISVLVSGLISALICSIIGIYLARKIAQPLEKLTAVAKALKAGDFSVRVREQHTSTIEVRSLIESFNAMATSLQTMEDRLHFNNMAIAHELRTPLTILRGSMQGMIDGVLPMERKALSSLLLQAESLSRIVEDLRTVSLAIGHKLVMYREQADIVGIVGAALESARPMLDANRMKLETDLVPGVIWVDAQRIHQAILALLENACRYASEGSVLRCEAKLASDGLLAIRFLDRGPGFPDKMSGGDIKAFWRGDASRNRATGGTGLGLSVVRAIATAHGGSVDLENRPGGGACVTMTINITRP